jgi:hypothetical protein
MSRQLICALLLLAAAGDPGPRAGEAPKKNEAEATPEQKKIRKQVLAYAEPPALSGEEQAKLDKLIKDLSSQEFTVREAASKGLVAVGRRALPKLRGALKSKDPEVANRAGTAIEQIEAGDEEDRLVEELRKTKSASLAVIDEIVKKRNEEIKRAELAGKGLKGEDLVKNKILVGRLQKPLELLKALRDRVATKDHLKEASKLLRKGKDDQAEKLLREFIKKPGADAGKVARARSALNIVGMLKRHGGNAATREALLTHIDRLLGTNK